jgi:hypothetical protein
MDDWTSIPNRGETFHEFLSEDAISGFDVTRTGTETGATVVGYDHDADPLDVAVPTIVAQCESTDPCRLPPLYDAVNPEALTDLFAEGRGIDSALNVTFQYAGYLVAVTENMLTVQPAD